MQSCKLCYREEKKFLCRQRFSKDTTKMRIRRNKQSDYLKLHHLVSDKVIVHFNMLHPLMKNKIISNVQSSLIFTMHYHMFVADNAHFTKKRLNPHYLTSCMNDES